MLWQGAGIFLGGFLTCLFIHKPEVLNDIFGRANIDIGTVDWYVWLAIAAALSYLSIRQILNFIRNSDREFILKFINREEASAGVKAGNEGNDTN